MYFRTYTTFSAETTPAHMIKIVQNIPSQTMHPIFIINFQNNKRISHNAAHEPWNAWIRGWGKINYKFWNTSWHRLSLKGWDDSMPRFPEGLRPSNVQSEPLLTTLNWQRQPCSWRTLMKVWHWKIWRGGNASAKFPSSVQGSVLLLPHMGIYSNTTFC